ncbi:MAG: murein L,D-transpeptidase catalytic domain family protein [Legionellales bacterium]|nr:murein L,D-transpeptidase catalytic domain family protein [Legionellales bacterium]
MVKRFLMAIVLLSFSWTAFANWHATPQAISPLFNQLSHQAPSLNKRVLSLALTAYYRAKQQGLVRRDILTVIDYELASHMKRMWVFNIPQRRLEFHTLVAHGRNSGFDKPYRFSNIPSSLQSSIGVFATGQVYYGHDGISLRLQGLEPGVNDRAYNRDIVIHGANYVSQQFAARHGRLGRSWGCPAVSEKVARPLIETIQGGSIVFAYYPNHRWLGSSRFLA